MHVRAGAFGFHHALGDLLAHRRHGYGFARKHLNSGRGGGPWRGSGRRRLLLLSRLLLLRRTRLRRRYGLWPACTLACAMLLNKALNILLADAATQACTWNLAKINIILTRHAAHQR